MRTTIDIDDELVAAVLAATGAATRKEAVRLGLEALLRRERKRSVRALAPHADVGGRPRRDAHRRVVIATCCLEVDVPLLLTDRDVEPYVEHLGLRAT